MKNKAYSRLAFVTLAIGAVNLIASIIFILTIPEKAPVHFNANLECDRIGSRWAALILPLAILAFPLLAVLASKSKNADKNAKPVSIVFIVIDLLLIFVNWLAISIMNSGAEIGERGGGDTVFALPLAVGAMFMVIGNYVPTIRRNKNFGLRLPWTLKNEKCWDLTHRFAGKVLFGAGFLTMASAVVMKLCGVDEPAAYIGVMIGLVLIATLIPSVYAYKLRNVS